MLIHFANLHFLNFNLTKKCPFENVTQVLKMCGICLTRGNLHLKQVKKNITTVVRMLQEIKAGTKNQPSLRYTLVL